jgi:probable Rubsico expression protein CbbX
MTQPTLLVYLYIRAVASGDAVVSPRITRRLLDVYATQLPDLPGAAAGPVPAALGQLTPREQEVLLEVATGLTNTEIAAKLAVSEATVKTHVGSILAKVKVQEIASLLMVDRARQRFGLEAPRPNLHMCFTGPPGTGKTTVALRMAELLHRLGYLERGHLVHAMRNDLVGEFIGQTAPKTKRVLDRAMGGVLFIDEAYYLYRAADSRDYGQEAIDILLQVMENDRDRLVVILAGYEDRMDEFFSSNPGMSSRIAHHLDFAAYDLDELAAIGRLTSDLDRRWSRDDLMRLEPVDFLVSHAELLPERGA